MGEPIDFGERENELKPWITNGTGGDCKTFSDWTDWSNPNADIDTDTTYALPNHLLCDRDDCMHMTDGKWAAIWDNCSAAGNAPTGHQDSCYNMITNSDMEAAGGAGEGYDDGEEKRHCLEEERWRLLGGKPDESDVENYFVEDEEEKGDDVSPEPCNWTPALDAGAEIRL